MTKIRKEQVVCPKCGKKSSFPVYESINTKLNPELKEKLYTKESPLIFTCPQCGDKTFVSYDFLYHDMEHQYMIWCVPSGRKPQSPIEDLKHAMGQQLVSKLLALSAGYRYRYVRDVEELLEKIIEMDSAYPDYAWEILKILYCLKINDDIKDDDVRIENFRFCMLDGKRISCSFMLGNQAASVDIPIAALKTIADNIHFDESDECIRVDDDWAIQFLQSHE